MYFLIENLPKKKKKKKENNDSIVADTSVNDPIGKKVPFCSIISYVLY